MCSGLTLEIPELRRWHYSDLYFVNYGHVFCVFRLKVIIVFINIVCALSWNDVAIIKTLFEEVAIVSQKVRAFFDSEHFSGAVSIMIISNFNNEPLAQVVVKLEPQFKSHRQSFSFSNNLYLSIFWELLDAKLYMYLLFIVGIFLFHE